MAAFDVDDVVRVVDAHSPYNGYLGLVVRIVVYQNRVSYILGLFVVGDRRYIRFREDQLGALPEMHPDIDKRRDGDTTADALVPMSLPRQSAEMPHEKLEARIDARGDSEPPPVLDGTASQGVIATGEAPESPEDSIYRLKLKTQTLNALRRNNVATISRVKALTNEQLLGLRGFGPGGLKDLLQSLEAYTPDESEARQTVSGPAMSESESVYRLMLRPRTLRVLWRSGIRTISALTAMTDEQLSGIHGFGYQSLDDVKKKLDVHHLSLRTPVQSDRTSESPLFRPQSQEELTEQFREVANALCRSFESQGLLKDLYLPMELLRMTGDAFEQHIMTLSELQKLAAQPDLQSRLANLPYSQSRVEALRAVLSWLERVTMNHSIDDEVDYLVFGFNDRWMEILLNRFRLHDCVTLEDLGNRYGITRQRVLQLESKMKRRLAQRVAQSQLFYSRAALLLLKRMGQDATLDLWKHKLAEIGYLKSDKSIDLLLGISLATDALKLHLSERLIESLRRGVPPSALVSVKPVLEEAHGVCRRCGAVRAASLATEGLSEANVGRILSTGGFAEISVGWWTITEERGSVPRRTTAKVLAHCGPVPISTIRHCLRRHRYRFQGFQAPVPPSDVLAEALERTGEFVADAGVIRLAKPAMRKPRLTAPEEMFVQIVHTKGPIVSFESVYEELLKGGFSGASVSKLLSDSPIVHKVRYRLYTLVGLPYDFVDVERARNELTKVYTNPTLKFRTDGVVEFETNIGSFMVYGGVLGAGPVAQMQGTWTLVVDGKRQGELLVQGAFIQNMEPARDSLGLVAGDRIKIEFNTWTREAIVRKVTNHDEAA